MTKMISITFMILFTAALAFSPERELATDGNPGCIVMPEVIEACQQGGGQFDYKLCSCVGGAN
jgi:hypothetical protein